MACPPSHTRTTPNPHRRHYVRRRAVRPSPSGSYPTRTTPRSCGHKRALSVLRLLRRRHSLARQATLMARSQSLLRVANPLCLRTPPWRSRSFRPLRRPSPPHPPLDPVEQRRPALHRLLLLPSLPLLCPLPSATHTPPDRPKIRTPLQLPSRVLHHNLRRRCLHRRPRRQPTHLSGTRRTTHSTRHCVQPVRLERDP